MFSHELSFARMLVQVVENNKKKYIGHLRMEYPLGELLFLNVEEKKIILDAINNIVQKIDLAYNTTASIQG